jgi:hypothetical protein
MAASNPKDPNLTILRATDPLVKDLDYGKWWVPAADDSIENAKKALEANNHIVSVANDKESALEVLKGLLKGESDIFAAHSQTLVPRPLLE